MTKMYTTVSLSSTSAPRIAVGTLLFSASLTLAAESYLSGTITDSQTGEPLIGATIRTQSHQAGTVTDGTGKFRFKTSEHFPLEVKVSYLGYKARSIIVSNPEDTLSITLEENTDALGEVVVVGYGTQRRTKLTGSVATLSGSLLENNATPAFEQLLSGTIPGVNVVSSFQPGASSKIRIRGGNSINANNDPLYVIDGFIYYKEANSLASGAAGSGVEGGVSPLSLINAADIERIEVLKDVSATAIYGSRGANGVVMITTKKGQRGKNSLRYDYSLNISRIRKTLDLLNARQFAQFQKTYFYNKENFSDEQISALGQGTDWQDALLHTALTHSHNISWSGGDENTRYLVSGNHTRQEGIIRHSDFSRSSLRMNLERQLRPNLLGGVNATVLHSQQNGLTTATYQSFNSNPYQGGITSSFVYGLMTSPTIAIRHPDGSFNYKNPYEYTYFKRGDHTANPLADLQQSVAESLVDEVLGNAFLRYNLGAWTAKAALGFDLENYTQNFFAPSTSALGLADKGVGSINKRRSAIWQTEFTLNYAKRLAQIHDIDLLLGYTTQNALHNTLLSASTHFTNEDLRHNNLAGGTVVLTPQSAASEASLQSIIGRINYSIFDRYNATATFRADHSSRFSSNHRWGLFPSLGLSWNAEKERVFRNLHWLDGLKVRASVGTVGNQEIGDYAFANSYVTTQLGGKTYYTKTNEANQNLKWETTISYDLGFDLTAFGSRLSVVGDFYHKQTRDLLLVVPTDVMATGVASQLRNVGHVENTGFELSATYDLLRSARQSWTVGGNLSYNRNRITSLGSHQRLDPSDAWRTLQAGEAVDSYYGLVFDGVVQSTDNLDKLPSYGEARPQPGQPKFRDLNNDDKINQNDRTVLGHFQPDYVLGLNSTFRHGRFDAFILFQGSLGGHVYNQLRRRLELPSDSYNVLTTVLDAWTPTHPSNSVPSIEAARPMTAYVDSRYIESTDYLRLRTLSVGYTLPFTSLKADLRLAATAHNLITFTGYTGYDPEVISGIDTGNYPSARTLSFSASLTF